MDLRGRSLLKEIDFSAGEFSTSSTSAGGCERTSGRDGARAGWPAGASR